MARLVNVKSKNTFKKLQKVIDSFPEFKLDVCKYNEGWNRADCKRSTIEPGLESDDVIEIIDDNDDTCFDWYVEDFKVKNIKRDAIGIIKQINETNELSLTEEESKLFIKLSEAILKAF
jgi:hypothetical protein